MPEFEILFSYLKDLRKRYFFSLSAFYTYEGLMEATAPNVQGEEKAQINFNIINKFKNFFLPSKESLRVYFLLELAKLLEDSDQSLHITSILNYAQSNIKKLSKNDFLEFHTKRGRAFIDELFEHYKEISHEDLKNIKIRLAENKEIIKKIMDYRDTYLAHDDKKKEEIIITKEEVEIVFKILADILDIFSSRLDFSSTAYHLVESDCKDHVNLVLEYLHRFEPYRLKEIEEKYRI